MLHFIRVWCVCIFLGHKFFPSLIISQPFSWQGFSYIIFVFLGLGFSPLRTSVFPRGRDLCKEYWVLRRTDYLTSVSHGSLPWLATTRRLAPPPFYFISFSFLPVSDTNRRVCIFVSVFVYLFELYSSHRTIYYTDCYFLDINYKTTGLCCASVDCVGLRAELLLDISIPGKLSVLRHCHRLLNADIHNIGAVNQNYRTN